MVLQVGARAAGFYKGAAHAAGHAPRAIEKFICFIYNAR